MNRFISKFKLKTQFLIGLLAMSAVLIVAVIYTFITLSNIIGDMNALENESLSEVTIAGDLQESTYNMMFDMTKFGMTGSDVFYNSGMEKIAVMEGYIAEGLDLSEGVENLEEMETELNKLNVQLDEYKQLLAETKEEFANMAEIKASMEAVSSEFSEEASQLYEVFHNSLNMDIDEIKSGEDAAIDETMLSLEEDNQASEIMYRIVNDATAIQVINYKAQATDDYSSISMIDGLLSEIETYINQLSSIASTKDYSSEINSVKGLANEYKNLIVQLSDSNDVIDNYRGLREESIYKVVDIAKLVTVNGMTNTKDMTSKASKGLASTLQVIIIVFLLAIVGGILFNMAIVNSIVKTIKRLIGISDQLSVGDVDVQVDTSRNDELGDLSKAFKKVADGVKAQVEVAERVASGDVNVAIDIRSDKDTLNIKLQQMVEMIQAMLFEVDNLVEAASIGKLATRGNTEMFSGGWGEILGNINSLLDVLTGFFDQMPIALMFADKDYNVLFMNEAGATTVGSDMESVRGSKCYQLFNTEDCNTGNCACTRAMETNAITTKETIAHIGGQDADVKYTGISIKDKNDQIVGFFEIVVNQTEIMNAQRKAAKQSEYQDNEVQKLQQDLMNLSKGILRVDSKIAPYDEDTKVIADTFSIIYDSLGSSIDSIKSYINEMAGILQQMSDGNLQVGIEREYLGEFVTIKDAINLITASLNRVLGDINVASEQVAAGARQVSDSAQALSRGASDQASSVEQITSSITEVAEQTRMNAENANRAKILADDAKGGALKGNDQMKETLSAMLEINESSANISKIIKVIDEIAFQTNILALNAAVEAARAGDHGKGFAVVAEEVRNLAARSANAAKETTVLIESSVSKVETGTKIANNTAQALEEIVQGVAEAADLVSDIAKASVEQATAIQQVNEGIEQISKVTQMNTATSEESASASEELLSQSELTQEMVGQFQLVSGNRQPKPMYKKKIQKVEMDLGVNLDEAEAIINLDSNEFGKY